jgi:hypothetical protein
MVEMIHYQQSLPNRLFVVELYLKKIRNYQRHPKQRIYKLKESCKLSLKMQKSLSSVTPRRIFHLNQRGHLIVIAICLLRDCRFEIVNFMATMISKFCRKFCNNPIYEASARQFCENFQSLMWILQLDNHIYKCI